MYGASRRSAARTFCAPRLKSTGRSLRNALRTERHTSSRLFLYRNHRHGCRRRQGADTDIRRPMPKGPESVGQNGHPAQARRPVDMGVAGARIVRNLPFTGLAAQLQADLVDLAQP